MISRYGPSTGYRGSAGLSRFSRGACRSRRIVWRWCPVLRLISRTDRCSWKYRYRIYSCWTILSTLSGSLRRQGLREPGLIGWSTFPPSQTLRLGHFQGSIYILLYFFLCGSAELNDHQVALTSASRKHHSRHLRRHCYPAIPEFLSL